MLMRGLGGAMRASGDVVGRGKRVVYFASTGRPAEIGLQLGKACYPCSS